METPRILGDGETIDLGGKRVRFIDTPHTPHGWDAGVLYEETTGTLLCGHLFTQLGDGPALTSGDVVGPAIAGEDLFNYSGLHPSMGTTIRRLATLAPRTLALMHGPSFASDGAAALNALADEYDRRVRAHRPPRPGSPLFRPPRPRGAPSRKGGQRPPSKGTFAQAKTLGRTNS